MTQKQQINQSAEEKNGNIEKIALENDIKALGLHTLGKIRKV